MKLESRSNLSDAGSFSFEEHERLAQPFAVGSSATSQHQDSYSIVSQRIMVQISISFGDVYGGVGLILVHACVQASMGYQKGKGLGKLGTGITQPVEESVQKGRRGLGYMLEGLEKEEVQWEEEEVRLYLL